MQSDPEIGLSTDEMRAFFKQQTLGLAPSDPDAKKYADTIVETLIEVIHRNNRKIGKRLRDLA